MNEGSLAPYGALCDLCLAYQRDKNSCAECLRCGAKNPYFPVTTAGAE